MVTLLTGTPTWILTVAFFLLPSSAVAVTVTVPDLLFSLGRTTPSASTDAIFALEDFQVTPSMASAGYSRASRSSSSPKFSFRVWPFTKVSFSSTISTWVTAG